jgi:hypothetical protein
MTPQSALTKGFFAALCLMASLQGQVAHAQSAPTVLHMLPFSEETRYDGVRVLEDILFNATQKTSKAIYAREYINTDGQILICGVALFGSKVDTFIAPYHGIVIRPATREQWTAEGCRAPGYQTLIDLR